MEVKKSSKANLEDKKVLFFQIGLITVLALLLIAFEWTSRDVMNNSLGELGDIVMEEEIIPITRQEEVKPPPPPPPQVPEILQIVEDDVNIDEFLTHIEDFQKYYKGFYKKDKFVKAVLKLYLKKSYSIETMKNKLRMASGIIHEQPKVEMMAEELVKLYNYKSKAKINL